MSTYQKRYNATPEAKRRRALNNAARRAAIRSGAAQKGDGTEVDHIVPLRKGGGNQPSNLRVVPHRQNEGWRKSKKGYDRG